jgi:hypothetical protein
MSSVPFWGISALLYGSFAAIFFGSGAGFTIPHVAQVCGQPAPDMRFTSTAAAVHDFLAGCGPTGREAYRALQIADLFYPLVFAVFLASSLALALRLAVPSRPKLITLAAVPFLASAFDYAENACAWLALAAWPRPGVTDNLLGLFSAAKSVTSWAAVTLLLLALAALTVTRCRALLAAHRDQDALASDRRR